MPEKTTMELLQFSGCGFGGALLGSLVRNPGRLQLPRIVTRRPAAAGEEPTQWLDLGFLAAPILGAFTAAWLGDSPTAAIAYGALLGYVGPELFQTLVIEPMLRRSGLAPLSDTSPTIPALPSPPPPPAAAPVESEAAPETGS